VLRDWMRRSIQSCHSMVSLWRALSICFPPDRWLSDFSGAAPSIAFPPTAYSPTSPTYPTQHELYAQAQSQAQLQSIADAQARQQVLGLTTSRGTNRNLDDLAAEDARDAPPAYGKEPPMYV
jgi:hypothetical protein